VSSLGKGFCLVRFPFMSLLALGVAGASFARPLPFFFDGVCCTLPSESSEMSLEEVDEHQTYIVKSHHSRSYLVPRVQSGSFPLPPVTFRLFFAGSPTLSPYDKSTTRAATEPQKE